MSLKKYSSWLLLALGALLVSGCANLDPEDREFYSRNILHPGMDADEKRFWYSGWRDPNEN
jgi:hypothetical protein